MSPWRFTDKACISACEKSGRWRSGIGETTTSKFCDLLQHCIHICCILFSNDGTLDLGQKASKNPSHIEHKRYIVNASFQTFFVLFFRRFLALPHIASQVLCSQCGQAVCSLTPSVPILQSDVAVRFPAGLREFTFGIEILDI